MCRLAKEEGLRPTWLLLGNNWRGCLRVITITVINVIPGPFDLAKDMVSLASLLATQNIRVRHSA
jgi:hypothetical protein